MKKCNGKRFAISFIFSLISLLILIRCGSNNNFFSTDSPSKIKKAGRLGSEDIKFSLVSSAGNNQTKPAIAFNNLSSNYLLVWEDRRNGNIDIYGEVIYIKYFPGVSTAYNFSKPIKNVIAYDQYEGEIPSSNYTVSGLGTNSVIVSGLSPNTFLIFISKDFGIATSSGEEKNPAVAFGCDGITCRYLVVWEDYSNGSDKPFINGKLYDGLFNETSFQPTNNIYPYYSYGQTPYNLNNTSVGSLAQTEPDVSFDNINKRFLVSWIDKNDIEKRYKFSPIKSLVSDLANTTSTTSYSLYSSFPALFDNKQVVYRKFLVDGTADGYVELSSDVSHDDYFKSTDVSVFTVNSSIILKQRAHSFKNEKKPKISITENGGILESFIAQKINFSLSLTYNAKSDVANYIKSGPIATNLSSFTSGASNQLIFRSLSPVYSPKNYEIKLYKNPYLLNTGLDSNVLDYSLIGLTGDKILVVYTLGDRVKKAILDLSTGTVNTSEELIVDSTKTINKVSISKALTGHFLVVYDEFDPSTNISSIKGLFLKSNGDKDGNPFILTNNTSSHKSSPVIVNGDNITNRFLILYQDDRSGSFFSTDLDIFGNFYSRQVILKPQIYLPITSIDFGIVYANTTSIKQYIIQNIGDANLYVSSIASTSIPPFEPVESSITISAGASQNLNVRFIPHIAGDFNGFLNISSNSFIGAKKTIKLKGKGVNPPQIEEKSPIISYAIEGQPIPENNRYNAKFGYGILPFNWQISGASFLTFSKISSAGTIGRDLILIRGIPSNINPPQSGQILTFNINLFDKNNKSTTYEKNIRVYPALSINDNILPNATQGVSFSYTLNVSGGRGAGNYTFENISSSAYPGKLSTIGLSLNTTTGNITGIPKVSGNFSFNIKLCDKDEKSYCVNKNLSISVAKGLNIVTNLNQIYAGKSISFQAVGGTSPYTWTSNNLNTSFFKLYSSGLFKVYSSTNKGIYNFTIKVTDSSGAYEEKDYTVEVKRATINPVTSSLLLGMVGKQYSLSLSAIDTVGAVSWSIKNGTLPPGLILESNTGIIYGVPTTANISGYTFTVEITDSDNNKAELPLTIKIYPSLNIDLSHLKTEWTAGSYYNQFISIPYQSRVSGNSYSFQMSSLNGLNLAKFGNYSGNINGTPVSTGEYSYTVTVRDNLGFESTKNFLLKINPKAQITSVGEIVIFQNYSTNNHFHFSASGGTGNLVFSMTPSNYNGIKITSDGRLYGKSTTLDTVGTDIIINVTDETGTVTQKTFKFYVVPPLSITTDPSVFPQEAMVSKNYSVKFIATGGYGTEPYQYSISNLPSGLNFTVLNGEGILSGIPSLVGDVTFNLNISKNNSSFSKSYSLKVYPEIKIGDSSLPIGIKNKPYTHSLSLSGGSGVFSNYSASFMFIGADPGGLSFNKNGTITGSPLNSGSYQLKIRVSDKIIGSQYYDEKTLSLNVYNQPAFTNISSFGTIYEGQNVSLQIEAINGLPPYSYRQIGGILPSGLSLTTSGVITGRVDKNTFGNYSVIVVAKDSLNIESESKKYKFYVEKLDLSGSIITNTIVGNPYLSILNISGGSAPYTALLLGNPIAPPGLTLTVSGDNVILSGTPTLADNYSFKIKIIDIKGAEIEKLYSLNVYPELKITNSTLPIAVKGESYNEQLIATGGSGVFSKYSTVSGNLPSGLVLNKISGLISGIANTSGIYNFTVRVYDSNNLYADKQFSLSVYENLVIQTASFPSDWYENDSINYKLSYSGGSGNVEWSLVSGSLPPGLTLNNNGEIIGKLSSAGTFNFTIKVSDIITNDFDIKAYSVVIKNIPISESASAPYYGMVGKSFSLNFITTDTNTPHTFEISQGSIPGISLITLEGRGLLRGVPTQSGDYTIVVRVTDRDGHYSERSYSFTIYDELKVSNSSLAVGRQGESYSEQLVVVGGVVSGFSNYSSSAVGLPDGLSINKSGLISGIPRAGGNYNVKIKVVDNKGFDVEREYTLAVEERLRVSTEITELYIGDTVMLEVEGGVGPYNYSIETLSVPFAITGSSIEVLTTAEEGRTYNIRVKITDSLGNYSYKDYSIRVGKLAIKEAEGSKFYGIVGGSYNLGLITEGGEGPYTYTLKSGSLPAGLILNRVEGKIIGVPTVSGNYTFKIQSEDNRGRKVEKQYTLTIYPELTVDTTGMTLSWTKGVSYPMVSVSASGGYGSDYLYSMNATNGLSIDSLGNITGTPLTAGTFTYTIRVEDALGFIATKEVVITINEEPRITIGDAVIYLEKGGEYVLTSSGGSGLITWIVQSGVLPSGVSIVGDKLIASSTASGDSTVTLKITDGAGAEDSKQVKIEVVDKILVSTDPVDITKAMVGQQYIAELIISGGKPLYKVSQKSIIPGITLSQLEGRWYLSGVPTQSGDHEIEIEIEDLRGVKTVYRERLTIYPELTIEASQPKSGGKGSIYNETIKLTTSGGRTPYSYTITGLPAGLTANIVGNEIILSGTPADSGSNILKIEVQDSNNFKKWIEKTLIIYEPITITLSSGIPSIIYTNDTLDVSVDVEGGSGNYRYSLTGTIPEGIAIDENSGRITGKIRGVINTTYTFNIKVLDDTTGIEKTQVVTTEVKEITQTTTVVFPYEGMVGKGIAIEIIGSNGTGPYTYQLIQSTIPGLSLTTISSRGLLSGVPTQSGDYTIVVRVTDRDGHYSERSYSFTIYDELKVSNSSLAVGRQGESYSEQLVVVGGVVSGFSNYSSSAVGLPDGLSINKSGLISGIPRAGGNYNVKIKVVDNKGFDVEREYTLAVEERLRILTNISTMFESDVVNLISSGGTGPYSYSSSNLPAKFNLTSSGLLSIVGPVSSNDVYNFRIRVTDSNGLYSDKDFNIVISALAINESVGAKFYGMVGEQYSLTLVSSGGIGSITWGITSGSLPPGVLLNTATGIISGVPAVSGSYNFTVTAVDSAGHSLSKVYNLVIYDQLNINNLNLPNWTVNSPYSVAINATGGTGAYYFTMNNTNGLSINSSTGTVSGIPVLPGTYIYTITVVDSLGFSVSKNFELTFNDIPKIANSDLLYLFTGENPSISLLVNNGTAPYTWTVLSGSISGVSINNDGTLSGIPAFGDYNLDVKVTDSANVSDTKTITFKVIDPITVSTDPAGPFYGIVNLPLRIKFISAGGIPPYNWNINGNIPGLSITSIGGQGILSGTPSTPGDYNLKVVVTDSKGNKKEIEIFITIYPELKFLNTSLKNGIVGESYNETIIATGGSGSFTYSISSGSLPTGLTLNTSSGKITGTPAESGSKNIKVLVTDSTANLSVEKDFIINVYQKPVIITNSDLGTVYNGQIVSFVLNATSGSSNTYYYSLVSGSLPTGLILDSSGVISGRVNSTAGSYSFAIKVVDSNNVEGNPVTFSINVDNLSLNTTSYKNFAMVNRDYSSAIIVIGGEQPFDVKLLPNSTNVPPGISVEVISNFITLKGKPTQAGNYNFNLVINDNKNAQVIQNLNLNVLEELVFDKNLLKSIIVGSSYSEQITVSGGDQSSLTFNKKSGTLPQGISLATNGELTGTTNALGSYNFTVTVTDAKGFVAERDYVLVVSDTVRLSSEKDSYSFILNKPITNIQINATGGSAPYTFNVTGLPPGINYQINEKGILLVGTPTTGGIYEVNISVSDSSGVSDTTIINISIDELVIDDSGFISEIDINDEYFAQLKVAGRSITSVYEWTIENGALPDGLTLGQNTGLITGKPNKEGVYTFTVKVTDKNSGIYGTKVLQIKVMGDVLLQKEGGSWKCFIATAAYGSYLHPYVQVLRDFRDKYLLTNTPGRVFVKFYYKNSPALAKLIAENDYLKIIVRMILTPIVIIIKYFRFALFLIFSIGVLSIFNLKRVSHR